MRVGAQLYDAARDDEVAEVTRLVAARADVHWEDEVRAQLEARRILPPRCIVGQDGWFPLFSAAGQGRVGAIAELVRLGADVNRRVK